MEDLLKKQFEPIIIILTDFIRGILLTTVLCTNPTYGFVGPYVSHKSRHIFYVPLLFDDGTEMMEMIFLPGYLFYFGKDFF